MSVWTTFQPSREPWIFLVMGRCQFYSGGSELQISLSLIPLSAEALFAHVSYFLLKRTVSSPLTWMSGWIERLFFLKKHQTQNLNSNTKWTLSHWRNKDCSTAGHFMPQSTKNKYLKIHVLWYWMIEEPVGGDVVKVLIALPAFNY